MQGSSAGSSDEDDSTDEVSVDSCHSDPEEPPPKRTRHIPSEASQVRSLEICTH
jgi:hypothetical protein